MKMLKFLRHKKLPHFESDRKFSFFYIYCIFGRFSRSMPTYRARLIIEIMSAVKMWSNVDFLKKRKLWTPIFVKNDVPNRNFRLFFYYFLYNSFFFWISKSSFSYFLYNSNVTYTAKFTRNWSFVGNCSLLLLNSKIFKILFFDFCRNEEIRHQLWKFSINWVNFKNHSPKMIFDRFLTQIECLQIFAFLCLEMIWISVYRKTFRGSNFMQKFGPFWKTAS